MIAQETPELELRDYLRVLRRRKWSVLLITLLVVAAAVGFSVSQTPVYMATAEVLVQSKASESLFDPNTGARGDPTRLIQTEIQVLRSRPVRDLVRDKIGNAPKVTASAVAGTDVLEVRAESTDPERAALVANTYATAYINFRRTQSVEDLLAAGEQIQAKIDDLQAQIDGVAPVTTTAAPVRGRAATTTTLPVDVERQKESLRQQQSLFRAKLDQLQVDAALKSGGAQLVTPAVAPSTPIRPTPRRNAVVALAVGLMLGVGLAFLRDYLDDSLKGKDDVERAALGVPVLGLIPEIRGWKDRKSTVLVSLAEPQSQAAEAYRSLRTSVQFLGLDRTIKIIQVTSPDQGEGKSTTIANLAVGLAKAGQRVVLVDADLRRPRIHQFFGMDNRVGFTSVLLGDAALANALQQVKETPRLYLLPSGPIPPNPSEMLASLRTGDLLRSLAEHADIVLIDCPPVLLVTDATVLAHRIDASLLVVNANTTKEPQLRRSVEVLRQVESPLVGVVVNGVTDGAAYGYGYGGYGYGYAYGADVGGRGRRWGRKKADAPAPAVADDRDWSVKARVAAAPPAPPAPPAARPAVVSTSPYEVVPEVVADERSQSPYPPASSVPPVPSAVPDAEWPSPADPYAAPGATGHNGAGEGARPNGGSGRRHPEDQPAGDER